MDHQGSVDWYIGREGLGVAVEVEDSAEVARGVVRASPSGLRRTARAWQAKYSWRVGSELLVRVCN
ncbi:MAG TPA: hypothetical protein VIU46_00980 [Gallionellaceae bacterium]